LSSRNYIKNFTSTTQPRTGLQIGDDWFNPTTNRLYKFVVQNGTSPAWTEMFTAATSTGYPGYLSQYYYQLQAPYVGRQITTAQGVFGVGADGRGLGITLAPQTVYRFTAEYAFAKLSGATSHTFALGFGGTSTLNSISYFVLTSYNQTSFTTAPTGAPSMFMQTGASTVIQSGIASATVYFTMLIEGTVNVASGGTFIPQYTLSADPLGAYSTQPGSFISIYPVSAAGSMSAGAWS
jgi:hypothetical protein